MGSDVEAIIDATGTAVRQLYRSRSGELAFHGWPHVKFVRDHAVYFAHELGADVPTVHLSALVHDLNHLVSPGSPAATGAGMRREVLDSTGVEAEWVERIEYVVQEAETAVRTADISLEAQALSDGDTLFKSLPVTPILFSSAFMSEGRGHTIREMADKIVGEQLPLMRSGSYFYSEYAEKHYGEWARINLRLWEFTRSALEIPSVAELVREIAGPQALEGDARRRNA